MEKRGISPAIATVLLIALVVVAGMIAFIWIKGLTRESVTKFGDQNIEIVCEDVEFEASYAGGFLSISNIGSVPIYNFNVKEYTAGGYETGNLREDSGSWPSAGLAQGGVFFESMDFDDAEKVIILPVLVGNSDSGEKVFECEDRTGFEIKIS